MISVGIHDTKQIIAQADHAVDDDDGTRADWVKLRFVTGDGDFKACLFFRGHGAAELADAYADAINGVMDKFAKPAPAGSEAA